MFAQPMLVGSEDGSGPAQLQVPLRDPEAVCGLLHDAQAFPGFTTVTAVPGHEHTVRLGRSPPDPAPQLVQL